MSMGTAEEEAVRKEKPTVDDEEDNAAETEPDDDEAEAEADEETPFECDEENKTEVHDALANMWDWLLKYYPTSLKKILYH